ncbi:hypothetical protein [Mucilaginibacter ginkgonis]|uniref:Uncharacterized protein n=1 Tax=Mucilaginibacter ginkgonis TaxID=2682091 RepID=A0A6I4HWM8_9SPHI|nr:hypothetical protein [Mucilaginibacter ginkgonis]QQL51363.1 hypothetical protein GO620_007940 [Mucilaginibacter ginkgonis]
MKKGFFIIITLTCFSLAAKAQTYRLNYDRIDAIKKFSDPGIYLKQAHIDTKFDSIRIAVTKANALAALQRGTQPVPMPFTRPQDTDHMPIAKLGDTETTHFAMLIKPIGKVVQKTNP